MRFLTLILILFTHITIAQISIKSTIDSLKFVSEIPYACEIHPEIYVKNKDTFMYNIGCGDKLFWNAVKLKEKGILSLIDQLDNLEYTLASFPYQGGQCKVADVAYIVLQEIIHGIPTAELLNVNPNDYDCGYCYYHIALEKKSNRKKFKRSVKRWYKTNKMNLIWISENKFMTCECNGKHPAGGYYKLK
ncbi:MAG: hypothetical protein U9R42_08000 [Bacteroidota bacterium]|nr:hypothetical protein [Bacteroidota bacterium]